jgi:hypothetical protein
MYPQGWYVVELNTAATKIAAGEVDVGVAKTNGFNGLIMGNVMISQTYAQEKLIPANLSDANVQGGYYITNPSTTPGNRMNHAVRYMASQTTAGKTMDKAKAYADVWFGRASALLQVS